MHDVITKLKALDLSHSPVEEIYSLMDKFPPIVMLNTTYDAREDYPKMMERAVQNSKKEPEFNTIERISFTLPEWNTVYKRASTPNNTMFYATPMVEEYGEKFLDYARITISMEACDLLREVEFSMDDNKRDITFGLWEVIGQLNMVTIFDPTKDYKLPLLQRLKENYLAHINQHPELKATTLEFLTYLSQEFSKPVKDKDNNQYMISAIFSEIAVNKRGYDGVIYPSVKADGIGLCIALHPNAMNKLKPVLVSQYNIVRDEEGAKIYLKKRCDVNDDLKTFKLLDIEEYHKLKTNE